MRSTSQLLASISTQLGLYSNTDYDGHQKPLQRFALGCFKEFCWGFVWLGVFSSTEE